MFSSSKYHTVRGNKIIASTKTSGSRSRPNEFRVSSASNNRGNTETSNAGFLNPFVMGAKPSSQMVLSSITGNHGELMLSGIMPTEDEVALRKFYRDMYYHDSVCGSCVDMMSTLPFSEYSLTGADDKELEIFYSALNRLNIRNALPEISLEKMVNGAFCSTLVFDTKTKNFADMLVHNLDDCTFRESPLYSADPEIEVRNNQPVRNMLNSLQSPYFQKQYQSLPIKLREALHSDGYILDPLTTLYLARNVFPSRKVGISLFKRVLPIYLLEKTLWRGTLVESAKRLRSMRHATAGDDVWEPSPDDLNAIVSAIQEAEMDPLGGIIATRNSVQIQEITQGGDFWKITDVIDNTTPMKLRALGISETFLSGEANFATMDISMNVFIENMAWNRSMTTHKIFYNKLFPIIAQMNELYTDDKKPKKGNLLEQLNDSTNYVIPTIHWHKQLRPSTDKDMLDTLNTLQEKGVPVSLRALAAAGGVSLESMLDEMQDDADIREKIKKFLEKNGGEAMTEGHEANPDADDSGEDFSMSKLMNPNKLHKVGVLARDYGNASEIIGTGKTGKPKAILNQKKANEEANANIVGSLSRLSNPNHQRRIAKLTKNKKNLYTGGTLD